VPAATPRVDPDVQLVAELPESDSLNSSSTKSSMIKICFVNDWNSPSIPWPTIGVSSIAIVTEPSSVNLKRTHDEPMSNFSVNAEDCMRHEFRSPTPQFNETCKIPILLDVSKCNSI
jgi:hypothetical protein